MKKPKPKPKPSRAIAAAALAVACFLLPAGVVSHGHDDGNLDGHDHHCVLCGLRDHSVLVPAAPALAAPAPLATAVRVEPPGARFRGPRSTPASPAALPRSTSPRHADPDASRGRVRVSAFSDCGNRRLVGRRVRRAAAAEVRRESVYR